MFMFRTQVTSDIIRDGLGVELLNERDQIIAEVFRSDRDKTVIVNTFSNDVSLAALQQLIARALEDLEPFEDGTALSGAVNGCT